MTALSQRWAARWSTRIADIPRLPEAAAVAIGLLAAAFILFANRGMTFYLDDWAYLAQRAAALNETNVFASQNGNWASTEVFVYRGLAEVFGIGSYLPWRMTSLVIHLVSCALIYVLARRRLGPWWALVPLALVLVSRGWETLLWPFQMGQLLSIGCWLGALVALDRRDWRGDLGASLLLVIALASSSFGPPLVLAVGVELVLSRWRGLWVLIAPAAAYLWWYHKFNAPLPPQGAESLWGVRHAIASAWKILPSGPSAVLGISFAAGRVVLYLLVALTILRTVLERRIPARLVGLFAAYGAYWGLVAWARDEIPDLGHSARYVDLGVVLFVLAGVELFADLHPDRWPEWAQRPVRALRARPVLGPALFVLVALIAARGVVETSILMKNSSGQTYRIWGQRMLAQQAALGIGRPVLQPLSPFYLETAGSFSLAFPLGMIEATYQRWGGNPFPSEASLLARSMDARRFADQALAHAEVATVADDPPATTLPSNGPPLRVTSTDAHVTRAGGCLSWSDSKPVWVRVAVPPNGVRVRNPGAQGDTTTALIRWGDRPFRPRRSSRPASP